MHPACWMYPLHIVRAPIDPIVSIAFVLASMRHESLLTRHCARPLSLSSHPRSWTRSKQPMSICSRRRLNREGDQGSPQSPPSCSMLARPSSVQSFIHFSGGCYSLQSSSFSGSSTRHPRHPSCWRAPKKRALRRSQLKWCRRNTRIAWCI